MKSCIAFLVTIIFLCSAWQEDEIKYESLTDTDGNTYRTLLIGTQIWMVENLKTIKLLDGTDIPMINDDLEWSNLKTSGYSYINRFGRFFH